MPERFETFADAMAFFQVAFGDYGVMDNVRWHQIVRHSIEWSEPDRTFNLLYDRNITTLPPLPLLQHPTVGVLAEHQGADPDPCR